jgi:hypothetical protein
MCALATPGTLGAAGRSRVSPFGTTFNVSPRSTMHSCCGFTTRFERGGAHRNDEQWDARDTRV